MEWTEEENVFSFSRDRIDGDDCVEWLGGVDEAPEAHETWPFTQYENQSQNSDAIMGRCKDARNSNF
jgi:hypothetical protein